MDDIQNKLIAELQNLINKEVSNEALLTTVIAHDLNGNLINEQLPNSHSGVSSGSPLANNDLLDFTSIINAQHTANADMNRIANILLDTTHQAEQRLAQQFIANADMNRIADILFDTTHQAEQRLAQQLSELVQSKITEGHIKIDEYLTGANSTHDYLSSRPIDVVLNVAMHTAAAPAPIGGSVESPVGMNTALSWASPASTTVLFGAALPVPVAAP